MEKYRPVVPILSDPCVVESALPSANYAHTNKGRSRQHTARLCCDAFWRFCLKLAWDKCGTAVTFRLQRTPFLTVLFSSSSPLSHPHPPARCPLLLDLALAGVQGPTGFHSKRRFGRPLQPSAAAAAAGQHDFGTPFGTPMHGHGTPANKKMTYNILQEFQSPRPDVKGACGSRSLASHTQSCVLHATLCHAHRRFPGADVCISGWWQAGRAGQSAASLFLGGVQI
jgi:hypothetical protein